MIITKKEWENILKNRNKPVFSIKVDFGQREVIVQIKESHAVFEGDNPISLDEKIKDNFCYIIENQEITPIAFFSEKYNRFYKLTPTNDWPTVSIGSVPMHKLSSPKTDTQNKIDFLKPKGVVLDTCMGLGYTAILSAKYAKQVITFERDENIMNIAKLNPLSRDLFSSQNIEIRQEDISVAISALDDSYFDSIVHDPPTFKLSPELFSEAFYQQLYRVLKPGFRLFHYTPLYKVSHGYDFPSKIQKKLKSCGFKIVDFSIEKGGILCKK